MLKNIERKLIEEAYNRCSFERGRTFHISFIVERNKILASGINDEGKTHPTSARMGRFTQSLHSELKACINFRNQYSRNTDSCSLYNVRLDRQGRIRMAKPCWACGKLLDMVGFKQVWYTDNYGKFILLDGDCNHGRYPESRLSRAATPIGA